MIPVLIVTSNDEAVWTLLGENSTLPELKRAIVNDFPIRVSSERPVAATWDSVESLELGPHHRND